MHKVGKKRYLKRYILRSKNIIPLRRGQNYNEMSNYVHLLMDVWQKWTLTKFFQQKEYPQLESQFQLNKQLPYGGV